MKKIKYDKKEFQSFIQGFVIGAVLILMAIYIPWAIKEISESNRSIEAGYIVETTNSGYEIKNLSEGTTQIMVMANDADQGTWNKASCAFERTFGVKVRDFDFGEYTGKFYEHPIYSEREGYYVSEDGDKSAIEWHEVTGYVYDAYIEKDGIKVCWVTTEFNYEEFRDSLSMISTLGK